MCSKAIDDDAENSIMCDSCLSWFHFCCVSVRNVSNGFVANVMLTHKFYLCAFEEKNLFPDQIVSVCNYIANI